MWANNDELYGNHKGSIRGKENGGWWGRGVFCAVWHLALKAKGITLLEIFFSNTLKFMDLKKNLIIVCKFLTDEKSITGGKFELVCHITNILFILYESKAQEGQLWVWCK